MSIDLDPDLPSVPLDEVLIEQVLMNVISNAIKYSPEGSEILIQADKEGDMLRLTIADEGAGHYSSRYGTDIREILSRKSYEAYPWHRAWTCDLQKHCGSAWRFDFR